MKDPERLRRRLVFGEDAEAYDEIRPGYPAEAIDELLGLAGLPTGSAATDRTRILEIGIGTGQLTRDLVARGLRVTGLEPDAALAAVARCGIGAALPARIEVLESTFEDLDAPVATFDLIIAATSFHWLEPGERTTKSALLLRPGGALALLANTHPRPYTGFFSASQRVYGEVVPEWGDPRETPTTDDLMTTLSEEITGSDLFGPVLTRSWDWTRTFSTGEYLRLLATFSDHRSLEPERRERLLLGLGEMIEDEYDGRIERPYRTVLHLAKRRPRE